ncbi:MAG TPA: PBP1A family penicillin-binding protein [Gemmatimonadaceae bacterium]|nr:PBP1A family penicillin-binding protein [Gemmatimonadaceae bacterium]
MHRFELAMCQWRGQPLPTLCLLATFAFSSTLDAQSARRSEPWQILPQPQSSLILARDGSLIAEVGRELRTNISIRTLPKYVPQAFVAIEDQRFYQHDGVDMVGIAGAIKDNILGERRGASTITQQLVGNMHPDIVDRSDRTLGRKIREQNAAREMEKRYTKEQILEAYLNQIGFAHGWYGIESASRRYFGKSASKLTLPEAATLAAMPKGPEIYEPVKFPARVRERRNTVLAVMAQQGYITAAQARAAQAARLVTVPNYGIAASAPWYVDVVRIQAQRAGVALNQGGYRIHTALDPLMQSAAVSALSEGVADVEARTGFKRSTTGNGTASNDLQGLVVAIDPTTGDVRALVGGRDYKVSQFDRAVDGRRQPGSSFKPIVYAAAIADSVPPNAIMGDTAIAIVLPNGSVYRPDNSDHEFLGPITLRDALAKSRNAVAVQVALQVGMDSVIALARRMGIQAQIAPYPSSAIGASTVQPLDMIAAYTTFANLGTAVEPRFIHRIEDRAGKTVYSAPIRALPPALDPRATFVVRDMMRDVVERGTASSIRRYLPSSIPVAGKTGTTNDNTDVWFIGLTPDVVAGVWLGFDKPRMITPGAAGGSLAAPVWGRMMARYYSSGGAASSARGASAWTPPAGVISGELDRITGQIATLQTPADRRYTEYFVEGTEPAPLRADPWKIFRWGPIGF